MTSRITTEETDWFQLAFGFKEEPCSLYEKDNKYIGVEYNGHDERPDNSDVGSTSIDRCPTLTSKITNEVFQCGIFSTPSLGQLRERNASRLSNNADTNTENNSILKLSVEVGDAASLHEKYPFSTIQVASQLNCLEFMSQTGNPENGVTNYAYDHTQGPACCLCTAPAIVYRNYYHPYQYDDTIVFGQKKDRQWNNLKDIEDTWGNKDGKYWTVKGGYTMSDKTRLSQIPWESHDMEELKGLLRIGVHEDTEITAYGDWGMKKNNKNKEDLITHVLSSACAIGYNGFGSEPWKPLAKLVLEACYEATLYVGLENYHRHRDKHAHANKVFLTLVGGGVFGNPSLWIFEAIEKACMKFRNTPLDVRIVAFGQSEMSKIDTQTKLISKKIGL